MSTFDPTLVPKGTLKAMAKRMHKHPDGQHLTLAQCQEVLARTFGHASWHALQAYKRPDRSQQLLSDPKQRTMFYSTLHVFLSAGVDILQGLSVLEKAGKRLERWDWADLARELLEDLDQGTRTGQALSAKVQPFAPLEAFLLKQSERGYEGLCATLQETLTLSRRAEEARGDTNHPEAIQKMVTLAQLNQFTRSGDRA